MSAHWLSGVRIGFVAAAWLCAGTAQAGEGERGFPWLYEIRGGVLAHDVDGLWSGERKESGVDFNGELVFDRGLRGRFGALRPNLGASVNSRGDTSQVYAGLLWRLGGESRVFLELGLGAAVHNGERETDDPDKKELGSRVLFRIPIEIGFALTQRSRLSLLFTHVSNAYLADENEGMDRLGLRYSFRF